jgi:hypoxanthine phosphoribosyltransferase
MIHEEHKDYSWEDVEKAAEKIVLQMYKDNWRPDYIVGITRGGLPLATILSYKTDIKMHTLNVTLNADGSAGPDCEVNCWMSEDAFGYNNSEKVKGARWDPGLRKNILIVDSINMQERFNWIKQDWKSTCLPDESAVWNNVWRKNVKFATMTYVWRTGPTDTVVQRPEYYANEISRKANTWVSFPWER